MFTFLTWLNSLTWFHLYFKLLYYILTNTELSFEQNFLQLKFFLSMSYVYLITQNISNKERFGLLVISQISCRIWQCHLCDQPINTNQLALGSHCCCPGKVHVELIICLIGQVCMYTATAWSYHTSRDQELREIRV